MIPAVRRIVTLRGQDPTGGARHWPVSVGAPIDYNVPEIWSLEDGYGTDEPLRWNDTPEDFIEELEREATGKFNEGNLSADYLTRERLTSSAAADCSSVAAAILCTMSMALAELSTIC